MKRVFTLVLLFVAAITLSAQSYINVGQFNLRYDTKKDVPRGDGWAMTSLYFPYISIIALLFRGGVVSRNKVISFTEIHHEGEHEEEDCEGVDDETFHIEFMI